ncbi:TPA: hypothetical protein L0W95_000496 [Enterococcus faecium]|uniref:hypothetical protein n=2 Tax=Enterococcus TaxID=1350 RepID=UPI00093DCF7D|nr:hypothetical protein [Enterococcus faecium]PHL10463.1 hypothetical protein CQR41_05230 [Enterococcus faecium]PHL18358.1 hypothetical protein CQR39_07425 [Enterococcus faecium]ROX41089.1 hypothetical protein EGW42_01655 [Enterococcus faecium]ROX99039.1 hypothetical protein EGW48_11430 [Enterococcus faecium]
MKDSMLIFTCDACHYCFPADEQSERCHDCGKIATRLADETEKIEYYRIRAEIEAEIKHEIKALNAE